MDDDLITQKNLTSELLCTVINQAYFNYTLEESYILVEDRINISISIEENKRSITYGAFYSYENIPLDEKFRLANDFSSKFNCLKCAILDGTVCISHEMWCQDGVTKKNFITFLRVFADSVNDAVTDIFGYSKTVDEA